MTSHRTGAFCDLARGFDTLLNVLGAMCWIRRVDDLGSGVGADSDDAMQCDISEVGDGHVHIVGSSDLAVFCGGCKARVAFCREMSGLG